MSDGPAETPPPDGPEQAPPRYGEAADREVAVASGDPAGGQSGGLGEQLSAAFGASARDPSRPDTAAAARGLGVSQRQVQYYLRGERAPGPTRAAVIAVAAQLRSAFGASARDPSRPDTAAAARGLGVSQRQVQRYLRGQAQPGPEPAQALTGAARRSSVADARTRRTGTGMRITVSGQQGINRDYALGRPARTITMRLGSDLVAGYYDAYESGGAPAALAFLENNSASTYLIDSWHFERVDRMTIQDGLED